MTPALCVAGYCSLPTLRGDRCTAVLAWGRVAGAFGWGAFRGIGEALQSGLRFA
ncbi:hypothetical protein [Xanthomonas cucurbitae]|uniref:hypothetical protein n=1 Tax=Xanthomonas cucurbitae TaxID=56453 RepID=UPI0013311A56|nr:hypothetical protein [Xanthomonas cucurbitae]WDM80035.1 hypothetical protein K6980_04810 [Xanthomonas cucurbitae]